MQNRIGIAVALVLAFAPASWTRAWAQTRGGDGGAGGSGKQVIYCLQGSRCTITGPRAGDGGAGGAANGGGRTGPVQADGCSDLWLSRNQVYKSAGYCFKTTRAIAAFGNDGCQYDDMREVPLSRDERAAVGRYAREEAALGCRP